MSEHAYITGWRDVVAAFRTPGRRLEALLVTTAVVVSYLACFAVATAVAVVANTQAVKPALKALFGWTLGSGVGQVVEGITEGGAVFAPVFFGLAWLALLACRRLQPAIDRWVAWVAREQTDVATETVMMPEGDVTEKTATASSDHAEVFARLLKDTEAFLAQYEGAQPVAHLVWEAAVLGFCHGTQHAAGRSWQEARADYLKDHAVLSGVLDYATVDGVVKFPALRLLALADFRAQTDEVVNADRAGLAADDIDNEGA